MANTLATNYYGNIHWYIVSRYGLDYRYIRGEIMTVKEKRDLLWEFCESHADCAECKFNNKQSWCEDYSPTTLPPAKLDEVLSECQVNNDDVVNHPPHYNQGGMECIDEMILVFGKEAVMNFCICNAWKYRKRAMFKNGQEDIDKSDAYLRYYKDLKEKGHAKF